MANEVSNANDKCLVTLLFLVVRLMRVAVSLGLCDYAPELGLYRANSKSKIMTEPIGRDGVRCL